MDSRFRGNDIFKKNYPPAWVQASAGMIFLKMLPACAGTGFAGMTFLKMLPACAGTNYHTVLPLRQSRLVNNPGA
jgi:UDP-N-acetylenolpyruvoylglucosamine reductase